MSTMQHVRPTVDGFVDATPYDPLGYGDDLKTEEQIAHFIGSNSHSPNPPSKSSFSLPPQSRPMNGNEELSPAISHRDSDLFSFAKVDSGFRTDGRVGSGYSQFGIEEWTDGTNNEQFAQTREPFESILEEGDNHDPPSRKSSGLATVSAQSNLLSPALTHSTTSPTSSNAGAFFESTPYKLLGGGEEMTRTSSLSTDQAHNQAYMQHTPMSKGLSSHTSPEPVPNPHPTSPIVRISRHESPARPTVSATKAGKRTRDDSGLLAPGHHVFDDDIDNLDDEQGFGRGRSGLSPTARANDDIGPSLNEAATYRALDSKNLAVEIWALTSADPENGYLDPNYMPLGVRSTFGGRHRAKSTNNSSTQLRRDAYRSGRNVRDAQERSTPGPNVLVDEESGDDDDDDEEGGSSQESAPASVDGRLNSVEDFSSPFGHFNPDERPLESYPWVDPIYLPSRPGDKSQPDTANAAMVRFQTRARDIETASRAATWGTRRLSDSTLDQVLGERGLFSRLKLTSSHHKDKDSDDEIRSSLQEGVAHVKQIYRQLRSNSVHRRKSNEPPIRPPQRTDTYVRGVSPHSERPGGPDHDRKESSTSLEKIFSRSPSQRQKTVSRPTTPRLNTGALAAITTAGLGMPGTNATSPTGPTSPSHAIKEGFKRFREGLSLHRHSSEDSTHSSHSTGSAVGDIMRVQGGPPAPAIPLDNENLSVLAIEDDARSEALTVKANDEVEDDVRTTIEEPEKGVKMAMTPGKGLIVPNFDGFKTNVRDVNPRLEEWLVDRLGQEQLRRYKRLVEHKIQHLRHIQFGTCPSKQYCAAGEKHVRYFQLPKSAHKESFGSNDGEVPLEALDEDEQAIAEGAVSEAQFPPGLPMPPVERLPAEFECPFCFQVKKFTKPSDWSKHVHEDLQPFTCTFKKCSDPKSFKRKADWVRHENERHRQLEWWECTEENCQHRCYRRDNFVQHLIREHKLPEPPNKPGKQPNKPAVRGPAKNKGRGRGNTNNTSHKIPVEEKVLWMVETCRHDTPKSPNEEKCRFCGNVCNTWKKLTVHLARHMEQLSIPVLDLVKIREVSHDTIISPLEQRPPIALTPSPVEQPQGQQSIDAAGNAIAFTSSDRAFGGVAGGPASSHGHGHMTFVGSAGQMQPSMFVQAAAMPQDIQNHFGHTNAMPQSIHIAQAQFPPDQSYGWSQPQQAMAYGATHAPDYGNLQHQQNAAGYGAGTNAGQGDFDASMYMGDASAFDPPMQQMGSQMTQWPVHGGNAQQYAGMAAYQPQPQQQQQQQQQQQGSHQGHSQQQQYGAFWPA